MEELLNQTPLQTELPQPNPRPLHFSPKFPLWGLIISAIAIAGYIFIAQATNLWPFHVNELVVISPTKKHFNISNWETLNNSYGWSIKYPPGWYADGHDNNTAEQDEAPIINGCNPNIRCGFMQIDSIPLQAKSLSDMSPEQFLLDDQFKGAARQHKTAKLLYQTNLKIGGQSAYEITYKVTDDLTSNPALNHPEGQTIKEVAVKYNGKIYDILYYEYFGNKFVDDWQLNPLFDKILSTFKFTGPINTSSWGTYRDEKYGFEIKIPPNWSVSKSEGISPFYNDILFEAKTNDPNYITAQDRPNMGAVFSIEAYTPKQYLDLKNVCQQKTSKESSGCYTFMSLIGHNNTYYFVYDDGHAWSNYPLDFITNNYYDMGQASIKTFKVTK